VILLAQTGCKKDLARQPNYCDAFAGTYSIVGEDSWNNCMSTGSTPKTRLFTFSTSEITNYGQLFSNDHDAVFPVTMEGVFEGELNYLWYEIEFFAGDSINYMGYTGMAPGGWSKFEGKGVRI